MGIPPIRERRWARRLLGVLGWRVEVTLPPGPKCVIAFYPHTSNWDFVYGYLAKLAAGVPAHFVAKHTLFRWPLGTFLRRMGGIPVDRRHHSGFVGQMVREMEARPWMWLAMAPEGTRAHVGHLHSGFYRLALGAKVPVGLAFIDYGRHTVGLTDYFVPSGDEEADLARLRAAYAGKVARKPENAGQIRFGADRGS